MSFTMFDHSLSIPQDVVFTIPGNPTIIEEAPCASHELCEEDKQPCASHELCEGDKQPCDSHEHCEGDNASHELCEEDKQPCASHELCDSNKHCEDKHCEEDKNCDSNKHCDNLLICKEDQLCCEIECQIDCFVEELQSIKLKLRNMHEKHRKVDSQLTTCMAKCSDLTVENAGLRDLLNRTTLNYDDSQNLLSKLQETNKNQSENLKQLKTEKLVLETFCKKTYTELTTLI